MTPVTLLATADQLRAGAAAMAEVERLREIAGRLPDDIEIYRLIRRSKARRHWLIARVIADRLEQFSSALQGDLK
jgi:hypothetical protein